MTEEFGNASIMDHSWGDRAEGAVKQAAEAEILSTAVSKTRQAMLT